MPPDGWVPALLWIASFSAFLLLFLLPTERRDWRALGVTEAFVIALFTEMFGFPLTLYVVSAALRLAEPVEGTEHILSFALGPSPLGMAVILAASFSLVAVGGVLIALGWRAVHRAGDRLAVTGVYRWVRHPQYLGLLLLTLGLLLWWPSILTIPMRPILAAMYVRLARREERELSGRLGKAYEAYRQSVGGFLPRRRPPH